MPTCARPPACRSVVRVPGIAHAPVAAAATWTIPRLASAVAVGAGFKIGQRWARRLLVVLLVVLHVSKSLMLSCSTRCNSARYMGLGFAKGTSGRVRRLVSHPHFTARIYTPSASPARSFAPDAQWRTSRHGTTAQPSRLSAGRTKQETQGTSCSGCCFRKDAKRAKFSTFRRLGPLLCSARAFVRPGRRRLPASACRPLAYSVVAVVLVDRIFSFHFRQRKSLVPCCEWLAKARPAAGEA